MPGRIQTLLPALLAAWSLNPAHAEPPPIAAFARMPAIRSVANVNTGRQSIRVQHLGPGVAAPGT